MKNKYDQLGVPEDERIEDPCDYMAQLAQTYLPLQKLGFKESARFITSSPNVIYDSEWCRVDLLWDRWEMYSGNSISVFYGRLHAPDGSPKMKLEGEECYCWHTKMGTSRVLDFLDGLTPQMSVRSEEFPRKIKQLRQSKLWRDLSGKRRDPELVIRMEVEVWMYYGSRLFELFDLRRPDLWEEYRRFLREYYDIKGRSQNIDPPLDKVC